MQMQIHELAKLAGVSVRTLHYYDEIGLLKPAHVDAQNGYRFYDAASIARMQEILFYRELAFPLKTIARILSAPEYDKTEALCRQKQLLTLKKERLERLIALLDSAQRGEEHMHLEAFDNSAFETTRQAYAREAAEKWGGTDAYKEHKTKTAAYSKATWEAVNEEMDALLAQIAACRQSGAAPADPAAQALVGRWQAFITDRYYTCTKEILAGLGEMYLADARFTENMDRHGAGTTAFLCDAIRIYCKA